MSFHSAEDDDAEYMGQVDSMIRQGKLIPVAAAPKKAREQTSRDLDLNKISKLPSITQAQCRYELNKLTTLISNKKQVLPYISHSTLSSARALVKSGISGNLPHCHKRLVDMNTLLSAVIPKLTAEPKLVSCPQMQMISADPALDCSPLVSHEQSLKQYSSDYLAKQAKIAASIAMRSQQLAAAKAAGKGIWIPLTKYPYVKSNKCSLHQFGHTFGICHQCYQVASIVEKSPLFRRDQVKNRAQYLRWSYRNDTTKDASCTISWLSTKKPYIHGAKRPIVFPQTTHFDFPVVVEEALSRAEKRMAAFNEKWKNIPRPTLNFQNSEFLASISSLFSDAWKWCVEKGIVETAIYVVTASIALAVTIWLSKTQPKSTIGKVFKTLGVLLGSIITALSMASSLLGIFLIIVDALNDITDSDEEIYTHSSEPMPYSLYVPTVLKNVPKGTYTSTEMTNKPGIALSTKYVDGFPVKAKVHPYKEKPWPADGVVIEDLDEPTSAPPPPLQPVLHKQGDTDHLDPTKVASVINKIVDGLITTTKVVKVVATSSYGAIHTTATILRDGKSIVDILQPLGELIITEFYEKVWGEAWIPPRHRPIMEDINPIISRVNAIETYPNIHIAIQQNPDVRIDITKLKTDIIACEEKLMKALIPPRYLVPLVAARAKVNEWMILVLDITLISKDRVAPPWFHFFGPPSSGKTSLAEALQRDVWENLPFVMKENAPKTPYDSSKSYSRKVANEYWEGYRNQFFVRIDDLFQDKRVEKRTDQALECIYMVNCEAFQLHMASLAAKENTYFTSAILFSTANGKANPSSFQLEDIRALLRRRTACIHVAPSPDRARVAPSHPDYKNGWVLTLHDSFGKQLREISYNELLHLILLSLKVNYEMSIAAPPAPLVSSPEKIDSAQELYNTLFSSNTKGVHQKIATATTPLKTALHKQGASQSSHSKQYLRDYDLARTALEKVSAHDLVPNVELHSAYVAVENALAHIDTQWPEFHEPVNNSFYCTPVELLMISSALRARLHLSFVMYLDNVVKKDISWFDTFCDYIKEFGIYIGSSIVAGVISAGIAFSKSKFLSWIADNKLATIMLAISALGAIAGIGAGIYFLTRPSKSLLDTQRGDYEKDEDRREKKRDKDKERDPDYEHPKKRPKAKDLRTDAGLHYQNNVTQAVGNADIFLQIGTSDIQFVQLLLHNMFAIHYGSTEPFRAAHGQITFVSERAAVTAYHVAEDILAIQRDHPTSCSARIAQNNSSKNIEFPVSLMKIKVTLIPGTESALLFFPPQIAEYPKIIQHFVTDDFIDADENDVQTDCNLTYRLPDGTAINERVGHATLKIVHFQNVAKPAYYWEFKHTTPNGSSGGILWTSNTHIARRILGTHSGTSASYAYASVVSGQAIQTAVSDYHSTLPSNVKPTPDVVSQLPILVNQSGPLTQQQFPVGIVKLGASIPRTNKAKPSPLAPTLREIGYYPIKIPVVPRLFNPLTHKKRLISQGILREDDDTPAVDDAISPLELSVAKMGVPAQLIPMSLLDLTDHPSDFPRAQTSIYILPTYKQCVFGCAPLKMDAMDMKTSPGFPWTVTPGCTTRKQIFNLDKKNPIATDPQTWNPEFMRSLRFIMDNLKKGNMYLPIFTNSLKIENRPIDRVLLGKIRRFYGGPIDANTISRVFLSHYWSKLKWSRTSENAVGINPHSAEWGELYRFMTKFPYNICTDMPNWDLSVQYPVVRRLADRIEDGIYESDIRCNDKDLFSDWSKLDISHAAGNIYMSATQSYHIQENLIFECHSQINSGSDGTSPKNGEVGRRKARMAAAAFILDTRFNIGTLDIISFIVANMYGVFYGDDQWLSVSEAFSAFTTFMYEHYMERLFKIRPTDPSKKPITRAFTPIREVTLLSRNFEIRDGWVYAPLKKDIIEDMLYWSSDPSNSVANSIATCRSALQEATHHGREYFNHIKKRIDLCMARAHISWSPEDYDAINMSIRNG